MDKKNLLNQIEKIEILLGELYTGLTKYPTLNLKNQIFDIIFDVVSISKLISHKDCLFDIRNVKKIEEIYLSLLSKFKPTERNILKVGHNLSAICFMVANLIIDVCIELDNFNDIEKNSEIHEYLSTLNLYMDLCGKYINNSFGINDIYID